MIIHVYLFQLLLFLIVSQNNLYQSIYSTTSSNYQFLLGRAQTNNGQFLLTQMLYQKTIQIYKIQNHLPILVNSYLPQTTFYNALLLKNGLKMIAQCTDSYASYCQPSSLNKLFIFDFNPTNYQFKLSAAIIIDTSKKSISSMDISEDGKIISFIQYDTDTTSFLSIYKQLVILETKTHSGQQELYQLQISQDKSSITASFQSKKGFFVFRYNGAKYLDNSPEVYKTSSYSDQIVQFQIFSNNNNKVLVVNNNYISIIQKIANGQTIQWTVKNKIQFSTYNNNFVWNIQANPSRNKFLFASKNYIYILNYQQTTNDITQKQKIQVSNQNTIYQVWISNNGQDTTFDMFGSGVFVKLFTSNLAFLTTFNSSNNSTSQNNTNTENNSNQNSTYTSSSTQSVTFSGLIIGIIVAIAVIVFIIIIICVCCLVKRSENRIIDPIQQVNNASVDKLDSNKGIYTNMMLGVFQDPNHKIQNIECSICLEKNVTHRAPSCGHVFHQNCIKNWLLRHKTCPNCRIKLKQNQLVQL